MSENPPLLRQRIISTIIALMILALAIHYSGVLKSSKKESVAAIKTKITNVLYAPTKLTNSSVAIKTNGVLVAKNKVDIVSRAQGIFERSDRSFRSGVYFNEGDVMVELDNDEFLANLRASKAQLLQSLTTILGDLKFDYAGAFDKWNAYVQSFDVNAPLRKLPTTSSDREKAFINSKNIVTQFYNIKAEEVKTGYYRIQAPFSGILRENRVDKGAMINAGQMLGTLIDPSVYEMEVKISPNELKMIKVGKRVVLYNNDISMSWKGRITRINKIIDPQSQSAIAIVQVSGKELREGMFLEADISTVELNGVAEISRNLLIDDKFVFVIQDSLLKKQDIEILHVADKMAFVSGLSEGDWLLQKTVSGAYDGMKVNPINLNE